MVPSSPTCLVMVVALFYVSLPLKCLCSLPRYVKQLYWSQQLLYLEVTQATPTQIWRMHRCAEKETTTAKSAQTVTVGFNREKPNLPLPYPFVNILLFISSSSLCLLRNIEDRNECVPLSLCAQTWEFTSSASSFRLLAPSKSRSTPQGQHNKQGEGWEQKALRPCEMLAWKRECVPRLYR